MLNKKNVLMLFLVLMFIQNSSNLFASSNMSYPKIQLVKYCEDVNIREDSKSNILDDVEKVIIQQSDSFMLEEGLSENLNGIFDLEKQPIRLKERIVSNDFDELTYENVISENVKKLCHKRTDKLIKSIEKHLKKNRISVVSKNGELIVTVHIKKMFQHKSIDFATIEEVRLEGKILDKQVFDITFDQSGQENKKNNRQIGEVLAKKIVRSIDVDKNAEFQGHVRN